jgi:hypothetical protein
MSIAGSRRVNGLAPRADLRVISEASYFDELLRERCTSVVELPTSPCFVSYRCCARLFAAGPVYPVWYTDPARTRFVGNSKPGATPITFEEVVRRPLLAEAVLAERRRVGRVRAQPRVIVEHCSTCGVRAVKDGCKGLVAVLSAGLWATIDVTEVSGDDWSASRFDMGRICRCARLGAATGG